MVNNDFVDDFGKYVDVDRLRQNFVNIVEPCLFDELLFNVAGACDDERLRHLIDPVEFSDALRDLVTVHDRHANVRDNESVDVLTSGKGVPHLVKALQAIIGSVDETCQPLNLEPAQRQLH